MLRETERNGSQVFRLAVILAVLLAPCFIGLVATQLRSSSGNLGMVPGSPHDLSATLPGVSDAPISVNWSSYHNYSNLADLISGFSTSYPDLVDAFIVGKTWEGRDIFCIKITDERVASSSKQQILVVAEHHAREVITQEAALYVIWYLLTNYRTDVNIQRLLVSREIYVIPCLNPDGMEATLTYNPFQRKNMHPIDDDSDGLIDEDIVMDLSGDGQLDCYEVDTNLGTDRNPAWVISDQALEGNATRGDGIRPGFISDNLGGVDLNRNYGFHFNDTFEMSSNSTNPRVEDFKGPTAFSEPETRAIKGLVESHRFIFAMSLHSGTERLLRPWSCTTDTSSLGANFSLFNMFGSAFQQSSGYPYYVGAGNLGYNASGEFGDWMYGAKGIPTMTCEIYGNATAYEVTWSSPDGDRSISHGIWGFFNPSNQMIEGVCRRTLRMLEQVCSINNYSSVRIAWSFQQPVVFNDGLNQLNLTWSSYGASDVALGSYTFLSFAPYSGQQITPVSNVFSLLSSLSLTNPRLSIEYSDEQLNSTNTDENSLTVLIWDSQTNGWSRLEPVERDTERNIIVVALTPTIASNVLYCFVLASYPSSALPLQTIILLAVAIGIAAGAVATIVIRYRVKGEKKLDQE